jgi:DNA-binding NarL/FixJ family response regulator
MSECLELGDVVEARREVLELGDPAEAPGLTRREREVITLIAEGLLTKQIAHRMGVSIKTAECHRTRAMQRLDLHSVAAVVKYAIREGLVSL